MQYSLFYAIIKMLHTKVWRKGIVVKPSMTISTKKSWSMTDQGGADPAARTVRHITVMMTSFISIVSQLSIAQSDSW